MKKKNEQTIGQAIRAMVNQYGMNEKLLKIRVKEAWYSVVGEYITNKTTEVKLVGKVLYVTIPSSELKSELRFAKTKLVESINEKIEENHLEDIRFN